MNVLIIPEDFRNDQYILKPIISALMAAVGKGRANVKICSDPLLGSVEQALRWERIEEIIERYQGTTHLFLLCVDRDGKAGRRGQLTELEKRAASVLSSNKLLLGENAWQEIEVWVLAGHDLPRDWAWEAIRQEVNPKEIYFEPFAEQRGVRARLGGGRKILAEEAARRYNHIRQLCPEDVANLEGRISDWIKTEPGE